jgi:DNA polymerase I-like protein with 3'-5' exonuclease and polymerase domains
MPEQLITSTYEHKLAYAYHLIDNRGILTDRHKMAKLRTYCNDSISNLCSNISSIVNCQVYVGSQNKPATGNSVNINYSPNLQSLLKELGFRLPKIRAKNKTTHEYEFKDSANKLVLQKVLADPTLWPASNINAKGLITDLLNVHTIAKVKSTYANAKLHNNVYYSSGNVTGTVTGRRSSRRHPYGLGGNDQNFPKYTELAGYFREALVARRGRIFFFVDQVKAEEWPVSALAENLHALDELRRGVNRHLNLASFLFSIPVDTLKENREKGDLDAELCYYLAKKTRHANNYGMRPPRMSEQLAAEGHSISKDVCATLLEKVNNADPSVQQVFHEYIKKTVYESKLLRTPLGRERQFFGFRSNDKNYDLLNEAYSWIPQSTVGDNTGLAILYLHGCNDFVLQDGHDSICQECPDDETELIKVLGDTERAFDRTIGFHNGINIRIPIEGEIGYDWKHTVKLGEFSADGLVEAYKQLKAEYDAKKIDEALAGSLS